MKRATVSLCVALSAVFASDAKAADCFHASILKPAPFMGNNDEIFQLSDGSIWQVKYEYEYLYAYFPSVLICPSLGKLIIDGKQLNVQSLSPSNQTGTATPPVIQTRISGEFHGWDGDTIYALQNGQVWMQATYHYHYHYAYAPEVLIYPSAGGYRIHVNGDDDEEIAVTRLR